MYASTQTRISIFFTLIDILTQASYDGLLQTSIEWRQRDVEMEFKMRRNKEKEYLGFNCFLICKVSPSR